MNSQDLKKIAPYAGQSKCNIFAPILEKEMEAGGIDTTLRKCHFLAQILHESGSLNYVKELASGTAYEGRKDLGNVVKGDGVKFKGRGLIQITGRNNYKACGATLGLNLIENPGLLELPENAVKSAIWFWNLKKLNRFADIDNIMSITKLINGGFNGLQDRKAFLERAKMVIK